MFFSAKRTPSTQETLSKVLIYSLNAEGVRKMLSYLQAVYFTFILKDWLLGRKINFRPNFPQTSNYKWCAWDYSHAKDNLSATLPRNVSCRKIHEQVCKMEFFFKVQRNIEESTQRGKPVNWCWVMSSLLSWRLNLHCPHVWELNTDNKTLKTDPKWKKKRTSNLKPAEGRKK